MLTMAKNPPLQTIFSSGSKDADNSEHSLWNSIGEEEFLLSRSYMSIILIIDWVSRTRNKEKPVIYIPDYYCYDTVKEFRSKACVVYYPVNEKLEPDYKMCREMTGNNHPDIFLFCHFWGKVFDTNDAAVFCQNNNAIFVEDAVHVLFPDRRIGTKSDFILFSPWKLLGLPDGAILVTGKKNRFRETCPDYSSYFHDMLSHAESVSSITGWKLKKIALKVSPNLAKPFNESDVNMGNDTPSDISLCNISEYSKGILLKIKKEELLEMGERRKENYQYLLYEVKSRYASVDELIHISDIPYMLPLSVDEKDIQRELYKTLSKIGAVASTWPNLSPELKKSSIPVMMKQKTVAVAVHDGISPNVVQRKLSMKADKPSKPLNISISKVSKKEYATISSQTEYFLPLLQSVNYAFVKQRVQGWKASFWKVTRENSTIGCFVALHKNLGVRITRINQGIVWIDDAVKMIEKNTAYTILAHSFSGLGKVLFLAPSEKRTGENMAMFVDNGFEYRTSFFSTGLLDLCCSEEELRKNLDSKWRNQLKGAEKKGYIISETKNSEELERLLLLHIQHKKDKGYEDSGDDITRALIANHNIKGYYIKQDDEVCAFVMITMQGKSATYYIGWNNEDGYKNNMNKLLLWRVITDLKENGFKWFDLGGIDNIHTDGVADFKRGIGGKYYEYIGEFVKL